MTAARKQIPIAAVFAVLLLLALAGTVQAQFRYTTNNGTITITGYTGSGGAVIIPDSINGLPVTKIGDSAFSESSSLTSVSIPNSVTSIGGWAFYGCTSLASLTIPNSVLTIGDVAFASCTSLTNATIGTSVTSIGISTFQSCNRLTSIAIPNSVTTIGRGAFSSCTRLTNVSIPNSVTSIGSQAFYQCTSLDSITIPNSVTSIGVQAFFKCTGLTGIYFQGNAPSLGTSVFDGANNLTVYIVPGTTGWGPTFGGRPIGLLNLQVPCTFTTNNGTVTITKYVGSGGSANIPNTIYGLPVTSIGYSAFANCTSLTNVMIGTSVTSLESGAFARCTGLTSVIIPNNVTTISYEAFLGCTSLSSITIPNSVSTIWDRVFQDCIDLSSVIIGNSVRGIPGSAFKNCSSLTSVTIPDSVTSIGDHAFADCTSLTNFINGNSVTSIGWWAFENCTDLTSFAIPKSVTSIGNGAFSSCTGLTNLTLGSNVTSIRDFAFSLCTGLTNVTIPNSVTSIGISTFQSCTSLTSVTIPGGVTTIGDQAFTRCSSLTAITVDTKNSFYSSVDGILFNKSQTTLIQFPGGKVGNYIVPSSVTNIRNQAFSHCNSLMAITAGTNNSAYSSVDGVLFNKNQTTLVQYPGGKAGGYTVPDSVTSIGSYAFAGCTYLTRVTLGENINWIATYAFSSCSNLTTVTLGSNVNWIESYAFSYCPNLTGIYFKGNAPSLGASVFDGDDKLTVYYLSGTTGWGPTFGGRPTAIWNPPVQINGDSVGIRTNQFGFNLSGAGGVVVVVEACTNLASPIWTPLQTNTLSGALFYFSDPQWTNYPGRFYRVILVPPNMTLIPAGSFTMGSPTNEVDRNPDEGPQTVVTISQSFWIGKYEVTQGEYLAVIGSNPSRFNEDPSLPLEAVTWNDATNYCAQLTQRELTAGRLPAGFVYRLPTEAEWEYASRAGATTRFSYGDDPSYTNLTNFAWFSENSGWPPTHPVGQKLPNSWGLYDMSGNVFEWCQDWYDAYPGGAVTDPKGAATGVLRVLRGGGYFYDGRSCRSAARGGNYANYQNSDVGFRVVLAPGQP